MNINALTELLQLSMMKSLSADGTDSSDSSDSSGMGGDDFSSMLQGVLAQMSTASGSNAQGAPEWVENNPSASLQTNNIDSASNISTSSTGNNQETGSSDIDSAIKAASQKYGVDESFIKAIIKQESGFNPGAVSKVGAEGLMQLMPSTARSLGVDNPFNVMQNVDGGTKYIKNLMDSFGGSKELALSAYNGGIGRMNNRGVDTVQEINKMPGETRNYVAKVMKAYDNYRKG